MARFQAAKTSSLWSGERSAACVYQYVVRGVGRIPVRLRRTLTALKPVGNKGILGARRKHKK
jgi:hypothetical protein